MIRILAFTLVLAACLGSFGVPLMAQVEEDSSGGFLVGFLEDKLSGDSRYIKVTGLSGAFSSRATIQKLTISDDDGVWLTVTDAVLDWNRLALVRGNFSVNTLSAGEIIVARAPKPVKTPADMPAPEATPFKLPELPVAINIGELKVDRLVLGEALVGTEAELQLKGTVALADGALDTNLSMTRLDRPGDRLKLIAKFDNATREITLDMALEEKRGGLIATALDIPDKPSLTLTAKGAGPVGDFVADIALASDGKDRLTGLVALREGRSAQGGIDFEVQLAGDVTPLLQEDYRSFFGVNSELRLSGNNAADGRVEVSEFKLLSNALIVSGALDIAATGQLERVLLNGRVAPPQGAEVVLPMPGPRTTLRAARVSARLDASTGNSWELELALDGLARPDLTVAAARIAANGTLVQSPALDLRGTVDGTLEGLDLADAALAEALGTEISLAGQFALEGQDALRLSSFMLNGADYRATVDGEIDGLQSGFRMEGTAALESSDLSRFSALAGRPLGGAVRAEINGSGAPLGGSFDIQFQADGQDLASGIAQLDPLIAGQTTLALDARRDETGLTIRSFDLDSTALTAQAQGTVRSGASALTLTARLDDLGRIIETTSGPVTLNGDLSGTGGTWDGKLNLRGPNDVRADLTGTVTEAGAVDVDFDAGLAEIGVFLPQLSGNLTATGRARRADAVWTVEAETGGSAGIEADLSGTFNETSGTVDAQFDAALQRLERLVPQLPGTLTAKGRAERRDAVWTIRAETGGDTGIEAEVSAEFSEASGTVKAQFEAALQHLERLVPQLPGTLTATGRAERRDAVWTVEAETGGSAGIGGDLSGTFDETSGTVDAQFDAALQRLERLVPGLTGTLDAKGTARRDGTLWTLETETGGQTGLTAQLSATFDQASGRVDAEFDAALARIERFVPEVSGTLTAKGSAARDGSVWSMDANATGPAGIQARLKGSYDQASGTADAQADGQLRLGGLNRFIAPNSIRGLARFDLALNGAPGIDALSGTITTTDATLAIPSAAQTVTGINTTVTLGGGQAQVSLTGGLRAGGTFRINGPVALTPPFDGNLTADLQQIVLTDNVSFKTVANGQLRFAGPLAGGGDISGEIRFGETDINIAAVSGSLSAAPIPPITHIGASDAVQTTRKYAGLIGNGNGGSGPVYGLDISLIAENRVFVRGRGLQAELGGSLRVRGTTAQVAPAGQIELIRGTLNLLTRKLTLTKGILTLQGKLVPYMEFAASTSTSDGTATLEISGPLNQPEINAYSSPERPTEEVLAMLVFGDQFTSLSPFKIAQLAASLATLNGSGGGLTENARRGIGVDTLDLGTDDSGLGRLGIGGYLSSNVYTDFSVNTQGETELNLNLDVSDNLTVKGTVDNKGETGLGLFFERDY